MISTIASSQSSLIVLALELIITFALVSYITWRIWQFTILPMLHPREPKVYPYLIPCHGLEYVNNGQHLLDRAREYFGDTREPFALMAGGTKLYFLTNATDMASMYKNTTTLDFHAIVKPLIKMFSMSDEGIEAAYEIPPSLEQDPVRDALNLSTTKPKSVMQHTDDFEHASLLPSPQYSFLESSIEKSMRTTISQCGFDTYFTLSQSQDDKSATVSLYQWTNMVLATAISDAIFGPRLAHGNPVLLGAFEIFGKYNWKLWFSWKDADDVRKAKEEYVAEIRKFLEIPRSEREPEESELWCNIESAFTAKGISKEDIVQRVSRKVLTPFANTRTDKYVGWFALLGAFWLLNFLLFQPELLQQVKDELSAAMPTTSSPIDYKKLTDESPYLNAVIEETLRLSLEGSSVRIVTDKAGFEIGGKLIPYQARIFAPKRQIHMDNKVWPEANQFKPERWLAKHVAGKRESYKPFGGGLTLCPGRFLAKSSIRVFLAIAFARFDIELESGQAPAKFKVDEPVQGSMYPVDGMDMRLKMTLKL